MNREQAYEHNKTAPNYNIVGKQKLSCLESCYKKNNEITERNPAGTNR